MYIEDIYVRSAYRGQGIGTKFFDVCEKVAKVHDCVKIKWECLEWNKDAQHFYKHTIGGKRLLSGEHTLRILSTKMTLVCLKMKKN